MQGKEIPREQYLWAEYNLDTGVGGGEIEPAYLVSGRGWAEDWREERSMGSSKNKMELSLLPPPTFPLPPTAVVTVCSFSPYRAGYSLHRRGGDH